VCFAQFLVIGMQFWPLVPEVDIVLHMTDTVDMDALAKRYIELWQDQMAQISADPSVTDAWRSVFENAAKNLGIAPDAFAAYTAAFAGATHGANKDSGSAGPEAAAAASGDGGADLADVLRRLDALERRLTALEAD
jgi:hypothetical protein